MGNRTIKLLLVDDDKEFIQFAKQLIGLIPDIKVEAVAASATKGVKLLLEKHFDMVLLDIDMPLLDGFQVMKQIQHLVEPPDPAVRPLFVVLCSGYNPRPRQCFEHGVSHFLEKPLSYDDLVDTIAAFKRKMQIIPTVDDLNGGRRLLLSEEPDSEKISPVLFEHISAITVNDTVCTVYLADGGVETYEKPLAAFMEFLPRHIFVRISRYASISLDHFMYRQGNCVYVKGCTETLELGGREAYPMFHRWYDENYEGRRRGQ